MQFEPAPRPEDSDTENHAMSTNSRQIRFFKSENQVSQQQQQNLKNVQRNFDIYKDMNIPKACHILGLKDKEFREGNFTTLKSAFACKFQQSLLPNKKTGLKWAHFGPTGHDKNMTKEKKRSKNHELVLLHEAFQYLVRRKSIQTQQIYSSYQRYAQY